MAKQTVVQKAEAIKFGSGKMEVSTDNWATSKDLGAMRGIVFEETWDELSVMSDNAGEVVAGIRNQKASLAGDLIEIDLEKLSILRGGIDLLGTTPGTPITDYSQFILQGAWAFNVFIPFTYQNGTGAKITPTTVTGSVDGLLVVEVDYDIVKDSSGRWGITITDSTTVTTEDQNITIVYDYTPAASRYLKSGGKYTMTAMQVRVTNLNEAGEKFIAEVYKAKSASGITIALQPDEGEDPAVVAIRMVGSRDVERDAGDQLFVITDEQNPV